MLIELNYCKCGCGKQANMTWHIGHNRKGTTFSLSAEAKEKMRKAKMGILNPRFGKIGTCLGRKQTKEQRRKIKEARIKQIITLEHRKAISSGLKTAYQNGTRTDIGEKKWNWKGGIRTETNRIRKSFEMKLWRESVFARDNFICRGCGIRGGQLHAHHIKPFALFPELRFAIDNGATLCVPCHKKTDTYLKGRPKMLKNREHISTQT